MTPLNGSLSLTVIVCPVADVAKVQATAPAFFWGAPVLSANGLAKWGVWDLALPNAVRTALLAKPSVRLSASDETANTAAGWVDTPSRTTKP